MNPELTHPVAYRKSGTSLNHVVGCPLDCGYSVASAEPVTVPAQHRVGGDDQLESATLYPGAAVQECGEQRAVRPGEPRPVDLPLQHDELVAQRQISASLSRSPIGRSRIKVNMLVRAR
ncbi:hypothetical protein ACFRIB_53725 [Streptomyces mirabilis]|uniref:hypothetical protein n=1 Tax=Streptomyces mirabilis TaxID=68239 RepID=UPI003694C517